MILLDTNVISELIRPQPDPQVLRWFETAPPVPLAVTSITVAELHYGIAVLPEGRRKVELEGAVSGMIAEEFEGLVLGFDLDAAEIYGPLAARYRARGHAPGQSDTVIAAIALAHGAEIATRNLADFRESGIRLHDPFSQGT